MESFEKSAPSLQNTGVEIMDVCGGNRRFGSGDRGLVRIAAGKNLPLAGNSLSETEILPGKRVAFLTLADGQKVELGKGNIRLDDGKVVTILNDSVDGLHYTTIETHDEPLKEEYNSLKIPVGGFYKLVLSDGTKVWLNADSELKYPVRFVGGKREVYLKGEGYFQVSKDSCRQFIVHLQNSEITVLGTAFNVSAYEDEAHVYTTLEEGRVALLPSE